MPGTVITAACSILHNAAIDNGIPLINIRRSNRGTLRVQGERHKRVEYHIVASAMFVGFIERVIIGNLSKPKQNIRIYSTKARAPAN